AGLRRPVRQGGGEDTGQTGVDPGRLALGERDAGGLVAAVIPADEGRAVGIRDECEQAIGSRLGRWCPVRAGGEEAHAGNEEQGATGAPGAARSSAWPVRGWHRRGKCATPMPWLIAR